MFKISPFVQKSCAFRNAEGKSDAEIMAEFNLTRAELDGVWFALRIKPSISTAAAKPLSLREKLGIHLATQLGVSER